METRHTTTAGGWLAAAGLFLIAALLLHPPPETETLAFLELIAGEGDTWVVAHWLAAASLALFAVTGLLMLTGPPAGALVRGAWGLLTVGALATMVTAVTEATVVADIAAEGDLTTFAAWDGFAAGMSVGFAVMGLAIAVVAGAEARATTSPVPRWSAGVAAALAFVSSGAWVAAMAFDVAAGAPVWLVSALLMTAWLVWYGIALVRLGETRPHRSAVHA